MEKTSEEIVSSQKVLSSGHDPGWNDPPSWALSSLPKATDTPTKRLLNKRVAFPINSKNGTSNLSSNQTIPSVGNIPPSMQAGDLSPLAHTLTAVSTNDKLEDVSHEKINKVPALSDTLNNFHCIMEKMETNRAEEIKKRLSRLEAMWNEDQLTNSIKNTIYEISEALKVQDVVKADQLHISLVMHDASVCSSWIPGIRQLIAEIKNKNI